MSWRHGPHHSAQKSTTTGSVRERSMTSCSKVASVASKITPLGYRAWASSPSSATASRLAGEESGEGIPVVGLHGLTATRRYVVMGSRALERSGHRLVLYDARGHGRSTPATDPSDYGYETLAADLLALLDDRGIDRAVLVGASMGTHTATRFALDHGDRVAGLVLGTPAYTPEGDPTGYERWDALAEGLRSGGVEGFVRAYGEPKVPERWRDTVIKRPAPAARPRTSTPRRSPTRSTSSRARARSRRGTSSPSSTCRRSWSPAATRPIPATRSRPASATRTAIPGAELRSEEPGSSPLAWQGGQFSKVIAELASRVAA